MAKPKQKIVQDLLKEANYYWYDENEDNINPLNPDTYDPVVDKIFKANAIELEKLYHELEESQNEITLQLSKTLVPDISLLPEPGFTVVQIQPKAARVHTTPEDHYQIIGQSDTGDRVEYYFTPLFEHEIPKCNLVAVLTDNMALQINDNIAEVIGENKSQGIQTTSFWMGLDIEKLNEGDSLSFFLGNKIVDQFDKNYFSLQSSKWLLDGNPTYDLQVERGVGQFTENKNTGDFSQLLENLEVPQTHEDQIISRLKKSFIHIKLPEQLDSLKKMLPANFNQHEFSSELKVKNELCWIKVELPLAVPNRFLVENVLIPNCIPLVNRRLKDGYVVKNNYDKIILSMPTTDLFLDVYKIQDAKNKEDESSYQRVDFLHADSRPGTYTIRSSSRVRRLNQTDASKRINRLLGLIEDEYRTFKEEGVNRLREDFDTIEKAINRIKTQLPDYFRGEDSKSSYFSIAYFRSGANRLQYFYWETQGDLIRHLGDKINLELTSNDVNISGSKTIIPIQKGKGELSSEDYINQLKISLLSRGRIMTKGDIELYCNIRYGKTLFVSDIDRALMVLEDGEPGRGILVKVKLLENISKVESELIRIELQNDLNAKSAFFTFIKVVWDE